MGLARHSRHGRANVTPLTIQDSIQQAITALQPLYDPREAAAVAKYYHESLTGWDRWALPLHYGDELSEAQLQRRKQELPLLAEGTPVQYVVGKAEFYGRRFQVTPDVLIPRPETEELVQGALAALAGRECPAVWDVGTGSGCIAVTIAAELPGAAVFATDISPEALAVARENAMRHQTAVTFGQHDMRDLTTLPFPDQRFDLIISNPPYIPERDRQTMHRNVVEHEPGLALFVPDEDPLWCYRALAALAAKTLKPGGRLMVETYHQYHEMLIQQWKENGLRHITEQDDINGRARFVMGTL